MLVLISVSACSESGSERYGTYEIVRMLNDRVDVSDEPNAWDKITFDENKVVLFMGDSKQVFEITEYEEEDETFWTKCLTMDSDYEASFKFTGENKILMTTYYKIGPFDKSHYYSFVVLNE
tara:strand:- start:117 stop:479 length:363 start_codon:yes stop_codon:yes gene_type:complete